MWLLIAPPGHTISITFVEQFTLDGAGGQQACRENYDWVKVLNGPNPNAPVIATLCSTNKPKYDQLNIDKS